MSTHGRTRDLGVDLARGVALVSMFVAHFAPFEGPGGVLLLSEFLTAPLFALLIGWGAVLGRGRPGEWSSVLVRTATLVGLGLLLEDAGAQIVVVLVWLGVLTALCAVLVRLPDVCSARSAWRSWCWRRGGRRTGPRASASGASSG